MSYYDSDSPATSESQTQAIAPFLQTGEGGAAGGSGSMSGYSLGMSSSTFQPSPMGPGMQSQMGGMMQQAQMPQMGGMMQQPQMGGMMPGYYNMPYQMPGYYNMSGMMTQQMPGMQQMPQQMPGMQPQMGQQMPQQMPGMQPQMGHQMPQQMSGMQPQMGHQMPGMQQMAPMMPQQPIAPASPAVRHDSPARRSMRGLTPPAADSVYRPYFDILCSDSPVRTAQETRADLEQQFPNRELFSFDELGISPLKSQPGQRQEAPAPQSRPGKGKATSSRAAEEAGAEETGGRRKRQVWTIPECVALAKAWISVVEDVYVSNNQPIDRMWTRISQHYSELKPDGSIAHPGGTCRKQWERLRKQLSRFAGLYQKNLAMPSSGMTSDDVKDLAHQQFPDSDLGFGDFKYWDVYLVVQDSPKFMAGVESGWAKRTKISASGEYSSSAGSHELPEAEADFPTRPTSARRRRPIGQKSAMRGSSGSRSHDVDSAPAGALPADLGRFAEMQMTALVLENMHKWEAAPPGPYKRGLFDAIQNLRRNLGMPPLDPGEGASGDATDDTGDGE